MQAASMPLQSNPSRAGAMPERALQIFLLLMAVVHTLNALTSVPILFGDISQIPGPGLGGWTITAIIAISPFVAIAAVAFALTGRLRHAVVAIAALGLLDWLNYLPSVFIHGLDFDSSFGSILTLVQFGVFPVLCIAAIRLALRDERPGLATAMAAVPMLVTIVSVIGFGIGVALYGF